MSISKAAEAKLRRILGQWTRALRQAGNEHGIPNSFGVVELAEECGLTRRDGYRLGRERLQELRAWLEAGNVAWASSLTYKAGRFYVEGARTSRYPGEPETAEERNARENRGGR